MSNLISRLFHQDSVERSAYKMKREKTGQDRSEDDGYGFCNSAWLATNH